jgi:hypothetical protein
MQRSDGKSVKNGSRPQRIALVLVLAVPVFIAGCDPAVTVRQGSTMRHPSTGILAARSELRVHVGNYRNFVGVGWYSPEIRVGNISDLPVTITSVAVVTERGSLKNSPRRPESFPLTVTPGATVLLDASFDLPEGLQRTFVKPAELRVHYRGAEGDSVTRVRLFVAH